MIAEILPFPLSPLKPRDRSLLASSLIFSVVTVPPECLPAPMLRSTQQSRRWLDGDLPGSHMHATLTKNRQLVTDPFSRIQTRRKPWSVPCCSINFQYSRSLATRSPRLLNLNDDPPQLLR